MSINPFAPVIPPDAFSLSEEGVTFVRVGHPDRRSVSAVGRFSWPAGAWTRGVFSAPVFARDAMTEIAAGARRLARGRLTRACVTFPDAWARTITLDFEALPAAPRERTDIVSWKIKKLIPVRLEDLAIVYREIPSVAPARPEGEEAPRSAPVRLLVSAVARAMIDSIEGAFGQAGIRVGRLLPATLALFDGFGEALGRAAGGDFLLLHRAAGTTSLLIARGGEPLFFRQKNLADEERDVAQELRLSLAYYAECFGEERGPAIFVCDEDLGAEPLPNAALAQSHPLSPGLLGAEEALGAQAAAHPWVWSAAAAAQEAR